MTIDFKWFTLTLFVRPKTKSYKIVYHDGMLSQPMPYTIASITANLFNGQVIPLTTGEF